MQYDTTISSIYTVYTYVRYVGTYVTLPAAREAQVARFLRPTYQFTCKHRGLLDLVDACREEDFKKPALDNASWISTEQNVRLA